MNFSLESLKSKFSNFLGNLNPPASGNATGANQTTTPSFWQRYALNFGASPAKTNSANNQAMRQVAQKVDTWRSDGSEKKKGNAQTPTPTRPAQTAQEDGPERNAPPTPKTIIIPLKEGKKQSDYDQLSRCVTLATLERNGIHPSNIEMEELMELPQSENMDMNGWLDKKWQFHDLPGLMPEAGKFTDINGSEVNGYKMTLSPRFQQSLIDDYKRIKGELALTPDKKAVIDMSMNERLLETVKIAYDKGYISQEIKDKLGKLTPEELAGAFAIGGAVGIAATSAEAAAVIGPLGLVAGEAYIAVKALEFDTIAQGAAKATNREQLDKPARQFGEWIGNLSKDGVLALAGMAGGAIAPRAMPKVGQVVDSVYGSVKNTTAGESNLKLPVYGLPEPVPATPSVPGNKLPVPVQGAPNTTGKTITVKPNDTVLTGLPGAVGDKGEQLKIVTVDSNGKPSGTRFRDDYEAHIKGRDFGKVSQRDGVSGAHNMKELEQYDIAVNPTMTKESINIISKTPHPTVKGIYKIEYKMPTLNGAQKPTGGWRFRKGTDPFVKTVYDPAVISDKQMAQWGREAFADAVQKNQIDLKNRSWNGEASNGVKFGGHLDTQNNSVRTFFVEF